MFDVTQLFFPRNNYNAGCMRKSVTHTGIFIHNTGKIRHGNHYIKTQLQKNEIHQLNMPSAHRVITDY